MNAPPMPPDGTAQIAAPSLPRSSTDGGAPLPPEHDVEVLPVEVVNCETRVTHWHPAVPVVSAAFAAAAAWRGGGQC